MNYFFVSCVSCGFGREVQVSVSTAKALMTPLERSAAVKRTAQACGFDGVGIAAAGAVGAEALREWLDRGYAGGMGYMAAYGTARADPRLVLPDVRSVIAASVSYYHPGEGAPADGPRGRVAMYARGRDYHKVLTRMLHRCVDRLRGHFPEARFRSAVDTAPLMEKPLAARAGLGWQGKHTLLIQPDAGSYVFLGEILTDLELAPDPEGADRCGTCARCIAACPTGAITGPYRLDSRRCIAYLTIEHRGPIPRPLRPLMGDWIFGCDLCQDVCPWNRHAKLAREQDVLPRRGASRPLLEELLALDDAAFRRRFAGTAVMRAGRAGLLRSACVALGNSGDRRAVPALAAALRGDLDALVRGHAAWALGRLGGADALHALGTSCRDDGDPFVLAEAELAVEDAAASAERA